MDPNATEQGGRLPGLVRCFEKLLVKLRDVKLPDFRKLIGVVKI